MGGVAALIPRLGEVNDDCQQKKRDEAEDASLRSGSAAAEERFTCRMRLKKVVTEEGPAVSNAEEEGLSVVPGGMKADGPPEGTGSPEAEAEDK